MFSLSRPSPRAIERFVVECGDRPLSYQPVGLATHADTAFDVDEASAVLGTGEVAFERAKRALASWAHFQLGWVEVFPRDASIRPGSNVAVLIRHFGFWSLNGCRVVYSIGEQSRDEFGFAYGTLTNHAESGEEVFAVTFRPESGEVTYSIRAVSRPRAALARLGYPLVRSLQARFRADSAHAIRRAVSQAL